MTEFIENPRRSPRMSIRCAARIAAPPRGFVAGHTTDLGPGGCGVATPTRVTAGDRVFVELRSEDVFGSHMLMGRVAWATSTAPWRCGIAFDRSSQRVAAALFPKLESANPRAPIDRPRVEKVPLDAMLTPTPVPGQLAVDPAEAEILRTISNGLRTRTLRERFGSSWASRVNSLFALLGRGVLEIDSPQGDRARSP